MFTHSIVLSKLTKSVNFVEDWHTASKSDDVVLPERVVVDVEFQRELGDFRAKCVWEFHWASNGFCCFFGHGC